MTAEEKTDLHAFEQELQVKAEELLALLNQGDFSSAMQVLAELSDARSAMLYHEVGRLTRGLHEAIKEFNIDVEKYAQSQGRTQEDAASEVASAHERLNYVLELTEEAANTTMDLVDASIPVASELGEQARLLRDDWKKLSDKQSTLGELKDLGRTTESFLSEIERGSETLHKNFTEILLAQGFQDITGQLITRVNNLVNDVEASLVKLVAVAGKVDRIVGLKPEAGAERGGPASAQAAEQELKGHGPQVRPEQKKDVVAGQDEVDDLLSSLGF